MRYLHRLTWPTQREQGHTKRFELRPDQAASEALAHASRQPPVAPVCVMSESDLARARIAAAEQPKPLKVRARKRKSKNA
jgi:hypothetical protein